MSQSIVFGAPTGQTITAKLFDLGGDTILQTLTATEFTNNTGQYTVTVSSPLAVGTYKLNIYDANEQNVANWLVDITAVSGQFIASDFSLLLLASTLFVDGQANKLQVNNDGSVNTDGGSSGSGTGSNAVTFTIDDGTTALQGAKVTALLNGSAVAVGTTDVSGHVTLALDSATYTITIILPGYNTSGNSLAVSDSSPHTYHLTALSVTASSPPGVTGYAYTYDSDGTTIKPNVPISYHMLCLPSGSVGAIVDPSLKVAVSSSLGLVQFTGLVPGAKYAAKSDGSSVLHEFTAGSATFQIQSFIG